jgi:hypothetical protein
LLLLLLLMDAMSPPQLRVWAEHANSRASCDGLRPATISSIICRPNSGGYGGRDLGIAESSFSKDPMSTKAGQLQSRFVLYLVALGAGFAAHQSFVMR